MNGYIAIYNGKRIEIHAESLYKAKLEAIKVFKPRKSQEHMISVWLVERPDGTVVEHAADF